MATDEAEEHAAVAAEQKRWADEAKERADALRHDTDDRIRSAAEHQAASNERLRRAMHRNAPTR